jgi:hypothetical protein
MFVLFVAGLLGNAFSGNEAASSIGQLVWAPLPLGNSGNNNSNNSHDNINTSRPLTPPSAGGTATPPAAAAATSSRAAVATAAAVAAAGSSVVWWPCEAIDPFKPPLGFDLQPEHKLALSTEERRKHLPAEGANRAKGVSSSNLQHQQQDAPKTPSPMGSLAAGSAAGATDGNPSSSNAAAAAAGEGEAPARRKLLLLWFHTNSFEWRLGEEVLPFNDHKQEFKGKHCSAHAMYGMPCHQHQHQLEPLLEQADGSAALCPCRASPLAASTHTTYSACTYHHLHMAHHSNPLFAPLHLT